MKTLKEYEQEKIDREQNFLRARQEEDLKFLEEIEARNIPLYEQTDDKNTYRGEMIGKMRDDLRDRIRRGVGYRQNVLCDHCGTELIERAGGMTLSIPPKTPVGCPGCGWLSWKTVA